MPSYTYFLIILLSFFFCLSYENILLKGKRKCYIDCFCFLLLSSLDELCDVLVCFGNHQFFMPKVGTVKSLPEDITALFLKSI